MSLRTHAIMVVRDECDIIEECVEHIMSWATSLTILDTGSVDGTWEALGVLANADSRIDLMPRQSLFFEQRVRSMVFARARAKMRSGDWFVRADADEFYPVPPPEFIKEYARRTDGHVIRRAYDVQIRRSDLERFARYDETERAGFWKSLEYCIENDYHVEPRIFRYRNTMKWSSANNAPFHAGPPCSERIVIQHYQHRNPVQIIKRVALRTVLARMRRKIGDTSGSHWDDYSLDNIVVDDNDPRLLPLIEAVRDADRNAPRPVSRKKRIAYLPIARQLVDLTRPGYQGDTDFSEMPEDAERQISAEYANAEKRVRQMLDQMNLP